MNNLDLEATLKSVPLPERPDEYWEHFPAQVRMNWQRSRHAKLPRPVWRPCLAWASGYALALAVGIFCAQFRLLPAASQAITQHEKNLHTQFARLDTGLHVLMFNPQGMGYLLNE